VVLVGCAASRKCKAAELFEGKRSRVVEGFAFVLAFELVVGMVVVVVGFAFALAFAVEHVVGMFVDLLVGIEGFPRGCKAGADDVDVVGVAALADAELAEVVVGIAATSMEREVLDVISKGKNPFEVFEVLALNFGDMLV
jgi:hypothetical protein